MHLIARRRRLYRHRGRPQQDQGRLPVQSNVGLLGAAANLPAWSRFTLSLSDAAEPPGATTALWVWSIHQLRIRHKKYGSDPQLKDRSDGIIQGRAWLWKQRSNRPPGEGPRGAVVYGGRGNAPLRLMPSSPQRQHVMQLLMLTAPRRYPADEPHDPLERRGSSKRIIKAVTVTCRSISSRLGTHELAHLQRISHAARAG